MFQIIGVHRDPKEKIVKDRRPAREALATYRDFQSLYVSVVVRSPEGETINGFELNRRADAEREADNT